MLNCFASIALPFAPPLAWELTFRGWFPGWAAVLLGFAAITAVVLLYLREVGRLSLLARLSASCVRALTLCLILFLVMKPSLLWEGSQERPRPIVVLCDDSQSMLTKDNRSSFEDRRRLAIAFNLLDPSTPRPAMPSTADLPDGIPNQPTRLEILQALLKHPRLQLLERLAQRGPVAPASFGSRKVTLDGRNPGWIDTLQGNEPRTALVESAFECLNRDPQDLPAALVIFSDGRENAGPRGFADLANAAKAKGVPIFAVGIGVATEARLAIRDVNVNETLYVDDIVPVPIRFRSKGYLGDQAEIVVTLNDRDVATKIITLQDGDEQRETVNFTPTIADVVPGKQELKVTVRLLGLKEPADQSVRSVRVVDRKLKVLVVDSTPRWDFKFIQRSLLRDRRVEARFWLSEGDRKAMQAGPPFLPSFPRNREELSEFDLLIFGDLPATALSPVQLEAIQDFVAEGGGFIHIAGRVGGPATFIGTPLADVLPVEVPIQRFPIDANTRPAGYRAQLTPTGFRAQALRLVDSPEANKAAWAELPELFWYYPVTALKPAAEALLAHPTARMTDGKPMPLVASHYYGKGISFYVGFEETWRWRYNEADRWFGRFWTQLIYQAGVPRTMGTKLTQLSLDTPEPQLGKTGQLYARLLKPDLSPQSAEQVEATLELLDVPPGSAGRLSRVMLRKLSSAGDYLAALPFGQLGRFQLTVDNAGNPGLLEYRVTLPPDHELAPGGLMDLELKSLAEATQGKFYREEDVYNLPDDVRRIMVSLPQRKEIVLWNVWTLLAVIGLLTAEWVLRKFFSLS